jgi:hypothetical protein
MCATAAAVAMVLLLNGVSFANDTSTVGTFTITFVQGTGATNADVTNAKSAFDFAIASPTMQGLVDKNLDINVVRDDGTTAFGKATIGGNRSWLDIGDFDFLSANRATLLNGTVVQNAKLVNNLLIEVMAHEIAHNSLSIQDPQFDWENTVLSDLNIKVVRLAYCGVPFRVDGAPVFFNLAKFETDRGGNWADGDCPPVGGAVDLLAGSPDASQVSSSSIPVIPYAAAVAVVLLTVGAAGWYARRRFVQR